MGNMTEVEDTTVPTKATVEDTPEDENGRGDKTEVEDTKAAEEEDPANEVDATKVKAEAVRGAEETVEAEVANETEATKEEVAEEVANEAEEMKEEDADGAERKRNTRKRHIASPGRESKRARKSAETFAPAVFSMKGTQNKVNIIRGRGSRLGSIPNVRKSIESLSNDSADLHMAHRLVFTIRGKPGKDDYKYRKDQLLAFSGYLTPIVKGEDQDQRAEIDEEAETKISVKAYKLSIPSLKRVCHVFDVDISSEAEGDITKDELIDLLLNFLGAPSVELTNANKDTDKKSKATSPDRVKEEEDCIQVEEAEPKVSVEEETEKEEGKEDENEEDNKDADKKSKATSPDRVKEEEDSIQVEEAGSKVSVEEETEKEEGKEDKNEEDKAEEKKGKKVQRRNKKETEKEVGGNKLPSDKALRKWVRAYVACFNMERATIKHALDTASDKFGVDLTSKKARIKELLTEEY